MRLRLSRHLSRLTLSITLVGTAGLVASMIGTLGAGASTVCGCEATAWGVLSFEVSENPIKIPVGTANNYNVNYFEIGGASGALKPEVKSGPFEISGGSCKGANLKGGEKCTVQIKCIGAKTNTGKVEVSSPEPGVSNAKRELECV
jgi:hypothetical protein